jgi:membrane protease YdiL (CAAX protease family)
MRVLPTAGKIYSGLLVLALTWIYFQNRLRWPLFIPLNEELLARDLLIGLGAAVFVICFSLFASKNFLWAQLLEDEFSRVLVPLPVWEIGALALLSGLVEEILFRGAIQPVFGLIPTSLLFGLAHFVPRKALLPWSVCAVFAGFLLGSLFELTHNLLPMILAHSVVNFVLILVLNRRKTMQPA